MSSATLTSKGQITIPAQVRRALGVATGDRVEFVATVKGQFAIIAATGTVHELKGLIEKPARPVSIEEMNAAVARQAASSARKRGSK
jgi:antitoxin PrlF